MERDQLDTMLDEWLDRASAEFGKAEPSPGFEQRMIARIQSRAERRTLFFRWQSLATAAMVVVVVCMILVLFTNHAGKQTFTDSARGPSVSLHQPEERLPQAEIKAITPPRSHKVPIAKPARGPLPSQDVISFAQLSNQDRLLQAYIQAVASGEIAGLDNEGNDRLIQINNVEEIARTEISRIKIERLSIEPLP